MHCTWFYLGRRCHHLVHCWLPNCSKRHKSGYQCVTRVSCHSIWISCRLIWIIYSVSRRYGPEYYDYGTPKSHFAKVNFDLDVDFTPVFNWNTKQVFVTVVAEYESKTHVSKHWVSWNDWKAYDSLCRIVTRLFFGIISFKTSKMPISPFVMSKTSMLLLMWAVNGGKRWYNGI